MALKLNVFTLNCGNGSLGRAASTGLITHFKESESDLCILNFQEVNFSEALRDLQKAAENEGLCFTVGPKMVTHTKLNTQFHSNTGLMSLVIHKPAVKIIFDRELSGQVRRNKTRLEKGYNKGGLLSRITVETEEEQYSIDAFSGHLDAFSDASRALDWANLHYLQKKEVNNWQELCLILPDLLCSGYDANTRNKFGDENLDSKCAWEAPFAPDMQSLIMAPLGNHCLSQPSTYHSHEADILITADKKRVNRVKGGMLDLVAYTDRQAAESQQQSLLAVDLDAFAIESEAGASRDHSVIGSQKIILQKDESDFERVRTSIACALVRAAPQLVSLLFDRCFRDSEENRDYLLAVYQLYLSPGGLLQKQLDLHAEKLQYLEDFQKQTTTEAVEIFQQQLFFTKAAWFELENDEFPTTVAKLEQIASLQKLRFELDKLQSRFLSQATLVKEREAIHLIVQQSLNNLSPSLSIEEQKQWKRQTKQLLLCNQAAQEYEHYLEEITQKEAATSSTRSGELLQIKREKMMGLKAILEADKQPSELISDLKANLEMNKEELSIHRHDGLFIKFYHTIKTIIYREPSLSQGAFFVAQTEKHLEEFDEAKTPPFS